MSEKMTMWRDRVAAWRASGQTAAAYAAGQGFSVNALRWWSSRLRREARELVPVPPVRLARVARKREIEVEPAPRRSSGIVIEIRDARARIAIDGTVDRDALAAVLAVLREGVR